MDRVKVKLRLNQQVCPAGPTACWMVLGSALVIPKILKPYLNKKINGVNCGGD